MTRTKANFPQLLFDRDNLRELVELLYGESLKDEEVIWNITQELLTTQDSLNITQGALQESKMEIEQLHEKVQRSHLASYTPFDHLHKVDCILEEKEESHEMHLDLQVLVKSYEEENIGQALSEDERKDEVSLSTRNMDDHIPYGSTNKIPYSSIDWVDRDTF